MMVVNQAFILRLGMFMLPLLLAGGMAVMVKQGADRERVARRLRAMLSGGHARQQDEPGMLTRLVAGVSQFGHAVASSGVLSGKALDGIRLQLAHAGIRSNNAVGLFLGAKIILLVLLPTAAVFLLPSHYMVGMTGKVAIGGAGMVGLLLPEWVLKFWQKRYVGALENSLPDMLDMLLMCTESGLSLEPAISRVSSEIAFIHPEMAQEMALTSGELHILSDNRVAFTNLGERSGVRGLGRLASTLIQTLQYGTPLAPSLRSLTAELRQEMLTKFEERAGRLPALLTVVMILFILPSLFMTVGGPAIIQVMKQMRN